MVAVMVMVMVITRMLTTSMAVMKLTEVIMVMMAT